MKKFIGVLFLVLTLGCFSVSASADTLKLQSTSGGNVGGEDVYPYNFSINGSSATTPLLCIDLNRSVSVGETWVATKTSLPTGNSQTAIDYRALAILDFGLINGIGGISNADYQYAAWSIFDPGAMVGNSAFTSAAASLSAAALAQAANSSYNPGFSYSNFYYYAPDPSNTSGWGGNGIPQEFMGYTAPAPAPEPSSLLLLGTGVLGVSATVRRRSVRAS